LKKAAQTYRPNPRFGIADAIRDVGVGEAITSFLQAKGAPGVAERTLIRPPRSGVGPIDANAKTTLMARSPVAGKYDQAVDNESAHEILARRADAAASQARAQTESEANTSDTKPERRSSGTRSSAPSRRSDSPLQAFVKSFARQLGTRSGQALIRGILGSLFKGR